MVIKKNVASFLKFAMGTLVFAGYLVFGTNQGVVIEKLQNPLGLQKAGFQAGDVLLGWERLGTDSGEWREGKFATVWDWYWFKFEIAPRGRIKLKGKRGMQPLSADLDPETIEKESVRPDFSGEQLSYYLKGLSHMDAGEIDKGMAFWEKLKVDKELRPWLALRSAKVWNAAGNWEQEKKLLALAQREASTTRAQLRLLMLRSNRFRQRQLLRVAKELGHEWYQLTVVKPTSLAFAKCLNLLGNLAWNRGGLDEAEKHHKHAMKIKLQKAPNSRALANSYNNLGRVAANRGKLDMAEAYHQRALKIRQRKVPGSIVEAASWLNLGIVNYKRGSTEKAEQYLLKVIDSVEKKTLDSDLLASAYSNLGVLAWEKGQMARAEYYHLKALDLRRKISPNSVFYSISLNNLGIVTLNRGKEEKAEKLFLEAQGNLEKNAPGSLWLADVLNNLGAIASNRDDWFQAQVYFKKVVAINHKLAPDSLSLAGSLINLGGACLMLGDLDQTEPYYVRALKIFELKSPESIEHGTILSNLAILAGKLGQFEKALSLSEQAYFLIKKHIGAYQSGNRFQILESGFRTYITLLAKQGKEAEAFNVTEEFRALAMLRQLSERNILRNLFPGHQAKLLDLSSDYDRVQNQLWQTTDKQEKERLHQDLLGFRVRMDEIKREVISEAPHLIEYGQPLDVSGVQQTLATGSLLLSYLFQEDGGLLFTLNKKDGLRIYHLPITKAALKQKIELLLASKGELKDSRLREVQQNLARSLFQSLLAPASQALAEADRLILILDNPLWHLPFAALGEDSSGSFRYLIEWKPMTTIVSATLYGLLKEQKKRDEIQIAAFGAPHYPGKAGLSSTQRELLKSGVDLELLRPLPGTKEEVAAIAALFSSTITFLGSQATETNFKSLAPDFTWVHVGGHAFFDPNASDTRAGIYFSIPKEFSEGKDNGILQYREIFGLNLNFDLLVLSACQTALGFDGGGQGLLGLTRAFQYAGVRSIIASLWGVDDRATAQLMKNFYRYLRAGEHADEALRHAQIDMIRGNSGKGFRHGFKKLLGRAEKDYSSHHYWAAFQLIGPY